MSQTYSVVQRTWGGVGILRPIGALSVTGLLIYISVLLTSYYPPDYIDSPLFWIAYLLLLLGIPVLIVTVNRIYKKELIVQGDQIIIQDKRSDTVTRVYQIPKNSIQTIHLTNYDTAAKSLYPAVAGLAFTLVDGKKLQYTGSWATIEGITKDLQTNAYPEIQDFKTEKESYQLVSSIEKLKNGFLRWFLFLSLGLIILLIITFITLPYIDNSEWLQSIFSSLEK